MQRDIAEAQQSIYEENFMKQRLQMEMDAKDSEIEQLRQKLSLFNIDTASINSVHLEEPVDDNLSGETVFPPESSTIVLRPYIHRSQKMSFASFV